MIWLLITLTNENDWRGCDMKTFQEVIEDMKQYRSLNDIVLDEVGNFSINIAIKKHHNCINYGGQIVKPRTSTDSEKLLAKMIMETASLALIVVTTSGKE